FYSSKDDSLFARMKKAHFEGKLYREQQFIAGLGLNEIPGGYATGLDNSLNSYEINEDYTVIQGIIDAFFYEGDDIVLVDYKTDNVKDGEELLGRYASQMYLYALTLEKLTAAKVKDVILYSTRFGEVHYPKWRNYMDEIFEALPYAW
ncbi:MAG: PD-(D/E)XK nuclease family protein, partial [Eubacterium sp.]|nr:PD-(D/E)XK nuclease family protein [Eubacterium sp.]